MNPIVIASASSLVLLGTSLGMVTLERRFRALRHQALHDALTGLPNRVSLREQLTGALRMLPQRAPAFAFALIDLDGFKNVNDTLGHHAGDALLQQFAARLRQAQRRGDFAARWGGDEFAMVLWAADEEEALAVTDRIRKTIEVPYALDGHVFDVSASVGIALAPLHGRDADTLVRHADAAMYFAKRSGRGHAFYDVAIDQRNTACHCARCTSTRS